MPKPPKDEDLTVLLAANGPPSPRSEGEPYDEHADVYSTLYLNSRQSRELHERLAEFEREFQALFAVRRLHPMGSDPVFERRWFARHLRLIAGVYRLNAARLSAQADNLESLARLREGADDSEPRPAYDVPASSEASGS